jgi:Na+/proline symporter
MLAIATESIVKLAAFLAVGLFVTFWMFDGPAALFSQAMSRPDTAAVLTSTPKFSTIFAMTMLSFFAIVLLPRQFHVTVVENHEESEIRRAAWLFPLYLVLINLFVIPIALAGLLSFPAGKVDSDMFVLALPLSVDSHFLTIAAFVGGLSAATAMVIVESVALAIMVSNDLVVPFVLQQRSRLLTARADVGALLLTVRRIAIFGILILAYLYYRSVGEAQLASIGLLSFAAVAQLAPAFFGGLIWRQATARGAIGGMVVGIAVWAYTLLLPNIADAGIVGSAILANGPFGLTMLRPQSLLGLDLPPLAHGVFWSLALNILAFIGLSLGRAPAAIERMHAEFPALALVGHGRRIDHDGCALSRRGAHAKFVRELRAAARPQYRAEYRGRFPVAAARRASARLGDRHCVIATGAVTASAQAHGFDQGRAQTARRCQCGDPL